MPRLFVRHHVNDYVVWRKTYDSFDAERRDMGVKDDSVFRTVEDGNDVTVTHDFDSMDEAKAFVSSARLREVMSQSGVTGTPTIWFGIPG